MKSIKSNSGFSLIEIMVVVVIISLLAGIVAGNMYSNIYEANIATTKTQMKTFSQNLELYKIKHHKYPSTSQGLKALMKKDKFGNSLIKTIPDDPWGNSYHYTMHRAQYTITTYGADGQSGGEGKDADIILTSEK